MENKKLPTKRVVIAGCRDYENFEHILISFSCNLNVYMLLYEYTTLQLLYDNFFRRGDNTLVKGVLSLFPCGFLSV